MPSVGENLPTVIHLNDCWATPSWHIVPRRSPKFVPVGEIERGDKRIRLDIALDDYLVAMNNGRTGKAPLGARHLVVAAVHWAEIFFPEQIAICVEAEQAFRTEGGDEMLPVRGGGRVAMRRFRVPIDSRDGRMAEFGLDNFAGRSIECDEAPFLTSTILRRLDISIEPDL